MLAALAETGIAAMERGIDARDRSGERRASRADPIALVFRGFGAEAHRELVGRVGIERAHRGGWRGHRRDGGDRVIRRVRVEPGAVPFGVYGRRGHRAGRRAALAGDTVGRRRRREGGEGRGIGEARHDALNDANGGVQLADPLPGA